MESFKLNYLKGCCLLFSLFIGVDSYSQYVWSPVIVQEVGTDGLPVKENVVEYNELSNSIVSKSYIYFIGNDSLYYYNQGSVVGDPDHLSINKDGHIWMSGAWIGANEYDGHFFTRHKSWDTQNGGIVQVEPDVNGDLWYGVVFGSGLFKYDGTSITQEHTFDSDLIRRGYNGNLWFATTGFNANAGQLLSYAEGVWSSFSVPNLVGSEYFIKDIAEEPDGTIWLAVQALEYSRREEGGVFKKSPTGIWSKISSSEGLPSSGVLCVELDRNNDLWVGTTNGVAYLKEGLVTETWEPKDWGIDTTGAYNAGDVNDIAIDLDNNIWIATRGIHKLTYEIPLGVFFGNESGGVFPNPNHTKVLSVATDIDNHPDYMILSLKGNILKKGKFTQGKIDLLGFDSGVYLIQVNGTTQTLIIE